MKRIIIIIIIIIIIRKTNQAHFKTHGPSNYSFYIVMLQYFFSLFEKSQISLWQTNLFFAQVGHAVGNFPCKPHELHGSEASLRKVIGVIIVVAETTLFPQETKKISIREEFGNNTYWF